MKMKLTEYGDKSTVIVPKIYTAPYLMLTKCICYLSTTYCYVDAGDEPKRRQNAMNTRFIGDK